MCLCGRRVGGRVGGLFRGRKKRERRRGRAGRNGPNRVDRAVENDEFTVVGGVGVGSADDCAGSAVVRGLGDTSD